MPRRKTSAKTTKRATKAARRTRTGKVKVQPEKSAFERFADYFKLGESYTSLVLGIIAVIIGTVLILSIVHTRQSEIATPEVTPTIAQSQTFAISPTGVAIKQPEATSMPSPAATATPAPEAQKAQPVQPAQGKTYTVAAGDNLWMISEKVYGSGYNWSNIAQANNLANPGDIHAGDKLVLPQVKKVEEPTVHTADDNMSTSVQQKIVADSYTVVPGDSLWGIALRAYGDGYQWVKIAKANNLADPNIIHKDNVLKIPRG